MERKAMQAAVKIARRRGKTRNKEALMDQINSSNMIICNDGSSTYIPLELNKRPTAIDITCFWELPDYSIGSYHMAIQVTLSTEEDLKPTYYTNHKQVQLQLAA